ncbi:MAG: hypothetical protein AAGJ80_20555 [Cyanobacteria bacterium J06553_1]
MKRGLRGLLEMERRTTRRLYLDLTNHYPADREELQQCRTSAFRFAYRRESERCNRKLAQLVDAGPPVRRPLQVAGLAQEGLASADQRITDKTGELSEVEKSLLGRGPKFALAARIDEETREVCQRSFARFAYQYRWAVARGNRSNEHPDSSDELPTTEATTW